MCSVVEERQFHLMGKNALTVQQLLAVKFVIMMGTAIYVFHVLLEDNSVQINFTVLNVLRLALTV